MSSITPTSLGYRDENYDNLVFLPDKPVISVEENLVGQISALKTREAHLANLPSGFLKTGAIREGTLSTALSGEVITNTSYRNAFALAAKGYTNRALINGWLINVSSTGTSQLDNIIDITNNGPFSTTTVVFLEAWAKEIGSTDIIKLYGNQDSLTTLTNDIKIPGAGMETTHRIQVQYRIRVEHVLANLNTNPDGFVNSIKGWGADVGNDNYEFINMSSEGDAGLYRAGNGTEGTLNTIDGYTYAIPMFLVSRRQEGIYSNASPESLYNASNIGEVGTIIRPDGKYANVVAPSDIVDLRHSVLGSIDKDKVAQETFHGISTGTLATTKGRVVGASGSYDNAPGGTTLIKYDELATSGTLNGSRLGTLVSGNPRRAFSNRNNNVDGNIFKITSWSSGVATLDLSVLEAGNCLIESVNELTTNLYQVNGTTLEGLDHTASYDSITKLLEVTVVSAPTGTSFLKVEVNFTSCNDAGFTDVPEKIIEQRYNDGTDTHINAEVGSPVYLTGRDSLYGADDRIELLGTEYSDIANFGQVAFMYREMSTPTTITINFPSAKMPGTNQDILGLRSIRRLKSDGTYSNYLTPVGTPILTAGGNLTVVLAAATGLETDTVEITLYLGTKFFRNNKEGRGITETFESAFVDITEVSSIYTLATGDGTADFQKMLIGYTCLLTGDPLNPLASAYVFDGDQMTAVATLTAARANLPVTESQSGLVSISPSAIQWPSGSYTTPKAAIFMTSWLEDPETATVTYETKGYQGKNITSAKTVTVLKEGPALITSSGSESSSSKMFVPAGSTSISTTTLIIADQQISGSQIQVGDLFYSVENEKGLRVSKVLVVGDDTQITFYDSQIGLTAGPQTDPVFVRDNVPEYVSGDLIGRLPSKSNDSYLYSSVAHVSMGLPSIYTKPILAGMDPVLSSSVVLGAGISSLRGATYMKVNPFDPNFDVGADITPASLYYPEVNALVDYKVYQSYLVQDAVGKMYLAILASDSTSGSEFPGTDGSTKNDVVDIFELKGRLLTKVQ